MHYAHTFLFATCTHTLYVNNLSLVKKKKKKSYIPFEYSVRLPCFLGEVRKCWIKYCFSLVFMHRTNDRLLDECPSAA